MCTQATGNQEERIITYKSLRHKIEWGDLNFLSYVSVAVKRYHDQGNL